MALVILGLALGGSHVVDVHRDSSPAGLPERGDYVVAPPELETPVLASDRGSPTPTPDAPDNVTDAPITWPPGFELVEPTRTPAAMPVATAVLPAVPLYDLICSFDWPCGLFQRIVFCESTNDPAAEGKYGERGLLQVHPIHVLAIKAMGYTWADMLEAAPNLTFSHDYLYATVGLAPWESSSNCWN